MANKLVLALSLMAGIYGSAYAVAALTPAGQQEIDYLFGYIANSGCEFYRNGAWYDAKRAEAHLRSKYGFLKYSVNGTEDFIEKAASKSSMSGEPYQVRCSPGAPVPSAQWLMDELTRFRVKSRQSSAPACLLGGCAVHTKGGPR